MSNQMRNDLGVGGDESVVVCGQWDQAFFALRQSLNILPLKERYADYLQFGMVCYARLDLSVMRPQAFHVIRDITN